MPTVVPEQARTSAGETGASASTPSTTAAGPGQDALRALLAAGGAPDVAAVADVFRRFPAEHAALTALVQGALGNQFMLAVLTSAPAAATTAGPAVSVAGPGLVALAKLLVVTPDEAPAIDDVIAILDAHPGEHEALVDALGTYLGDAYVVDVGKRMPHLRVHWKQLHLVAGDPNAPTGNFLEAGKELEGGRFRVGMGSGTVAGTFGGDVGYDVSGSWQNGNFVRASEKLDGAEWKFGKFTGKAIGGNVDAQYAFTDLKQLRLHFDGKQSTGTLGFYRSNKLVGPELAVRYKSGNDYSVGLQRRFDLGQGVTGTVGARHLVNPHLGVGDPNYVAPTLASGVNPWGPVPGKTTTEKSREALTFDATGKGWDAHAYAGVHPDGQFTAGLYGNAMLGPQTKLTGSAGLDGKEARLSASLLHTWKPGLTSGAEFYADPSITRAGVSTAYSQRPDGSGLSMSAALRYIDQTGAPPTWDAGFVQRYVGKNIIEQLSMGSSFGQQNAFRADASLDMRMNEKVFASMFTHWSLSDATGHTGDAGGELVFTPAGKHAIKLAFIVNGNAEYETMVEYSVLKKALSTVRDYNESKRKATLSVFASYGQHGATSMFDRDYGAPDKSVQWEFDKQQRLILGVRLHF